MTKRKKNLGDFHQTVALDEIAYNQIHEMATNIGGTVSSTLRMVIREAFARREREMAAQQWQTKNGGSQQHLPPPTKERQFDNIIIDIIYGRLLCQIIFQ